jgi:hypothetical protein
MQKERALGFYNWEQFLSILSQAIRFIDVVVWSELLGIGVALRCARWHIILLYCSMVTFL